MAKSGGRTGGGGANKTSQDGLWNGALGKNGVSSQSRRARPEELPSKRKGVHIRRQLTGEEWGWEHDGKASTQTSAFGHTLSCWDMQFVREHTGSKKKPAKTTPSNARPLG